MYESEIEDEVQKLELLSAADRIAEKIRSKNRAIQKYQQKRESKLIDESFEVTTIPRKNSAVLEEEVLSEVQNVLKRVKESQGTGRVLLLFYDIPARAEKLKAENIESEEALRSLSDE